MSNLQDIGRGSPDRQVRETVMTLPVRVEAALKAAIDRADTPSAPPGLIKALRYAVFPGGARVRPMLCLAVARACGIHPINAASQNLPWRASTLTNAQMLITIHSG